MSSIKKCAKGQTASLFEASAFSKRLPYPKPRTKGQTGLILIVLVVIIFAGIVIFLFSLAGTISQEEYMNIYVHNLLLTTMRTDTGYVDSNCKLVSDLLACAFLNPTWRCGGSGPNCFDLANQTVNDYMNRSVRKNYRYLLVVSPESFVTPTETYQPFRLEIGDKALETERITKITANEVIQREGYILGVTLIIAKRTERSR